MYCSTKSQFFEEAQIKSINSSFTLFSIFHSDTFYIIFIISGYIIQLTDEMPPKKWYNG